MSFISQDTGDTSPAFERAIPKVSPTEHDFMSNKSPAPPGLPEGNHNSSPYINKMVEIY